MHTKIFDPSGVCEVTMSHVPRLGSLEGKTICLLSDDMWQADRMLSLVQELLQEQFPTAKIIHHTEFPMGTAQIDSDRTIEILLDSGSQGVILGNAA